MSCLICRLLCRNLSRTKQSPLVALLGKSNSSRLFLRVPASCQELTQRQLSSLSTCKGVYNRMASKEEVKDKKEEGGGSPPARNSSSKAGEGAKDKNKGGGSPPARNNSSKAGEGGAKDKSEGAKDKSEGAKDKCEGAKDKNEGGKDKNEGGKDKNEGAGPARYTTRRSLLNEHQKEVDEARKRFLEMEIEEKRKLYKCKDKFVNLSDVPTWPEYFTSDLAEDDTVTDWFKVNEKKVEKEVREDLNQKLSIFRGDITTLEIDAIANAANETLLGGGGVDGAIHRASGSKLRSECELLNGCSPGEAKITCGYKLPAKYVIHTVGPRGEWPQVLENCYSRCLKLLKENNLTSLAFPCISTGIFGYPNLKAAKVALSTIRTFLEEDDYGPQVERIILCLFMMEDVDIYHEQMQMFFPLDKSNYSTTKKTSGNESTSKEKTETESKDPGDKP